jgi:haloacetate dehalogenase
VGRDGFWQESRRHPLDVWKRWATNVSGVAIDSGHFMAEEAPDETLGAMLPFLQGLHA